MYRLLALSVSLLLISWCAKADESKTYYDAWANCFKIEQKDGRLCNKQAWAAEIFRLTATLQVNEPNSPKIYWYKDKAVDLLKEEIVGRDRDGNNVRIPEGYYVRRSTRHTACYKKLDLNRDDLNGNFYWCKYLIDDTAPEGPGFTRP